MTCNGTINIQAIPTNWLWLGTDTADGTHGGGGPLPGILDDPDGNYIQSDDGFGAGGTILPD